MKRVRKGTFEAMDALFARLDDGLQRKIRTGSAALFVRSCFERLEGVKAGQTWDEVAAAGQKLGFRHSPNALKLAFLAEKRRRAAMAERATLPAAPAPAPAPQLAPLPQTAPDGRKLTFAESLVQQHAGLEAQGTQGAAKAHEGTPVPANAHGGTSAPENRVHSVPENAHVGTPVPANRVHSVPAEAPAKAHVGTSMPTKAHSGTPVPVAAPAGAFPEPAPAGVAPSSLGWRHWSPGVEAYMRDVPELPPKPFCPPPGSMPPATAEQVKAANDWMVLGFERNDVIRDNDKIIARGDKTRPADVMAAWAVKDWIFMRPPMGEGGHPTGLARVARFRGWPRPEGSRVCLELERDRTAPYSLEEVAYILGVMVRVPQALHKALELPRMLLDLDLRAQIPDKLRWVKTRDGFEFDALVPPDDYGAGEERDADDRTKRRDLSWLRALKSAQDDLIERRLLVLTH